MASRQLSIRYAWHNRPLRNYCHALDKLGYTKALAEKRVQIADNAAECVTEVTNRVFEESTYAIIHGSRGEGVSVSMNSDIDVMFVQPAIKCFATCTEADVLTDGCIAVFQLELDDVPKGYAKLQSRSIQDKSKVLNKYNELVGTLNDSLTEAKYLKNDGDFIAAIESYTKHNKVEGWVQQNQHFNKRTGPSRPSDKPLPLIGKYLSTDNVAAFPCSYPSVFEEWYRRERKGIWPSESDRNEVKKTDLFVVPVGHAKHEEELLQWRISFTLAERFLVRSFNDTQLKVYVAMKMLVKQELKKPICAGVTSYVVKNVIFWEFEERSGTFKRDDFSEILMHVLKRMKAYVESRSLPSYIFPSRNLLEDKISEQERAELIPRLDYLIKEGPSVLYRCPLIKEMYDLSEDDVRRRLLFRELSDQCLLAFGSLEPSRYDKELVPLFYETQDEAQLIELLDSYVLPLIKESNPFGFFTRLVEMKSEDIKWLMFRGVNEFGNIWMD